MTIEQTPLVQTTPKVVSVPDWVIAQQNPNYDNEQRGFASDECNDQGLVGLDAQVAQLDGLVSHEKSRQRFYDPLIARRIRLDSPQTSFPLTRYEESREVISEAQRHHWLALEQISYAVLGGTLGYVPSILAQNNTQNEAFPDFDWTNFTAIGVAGAAVARVLIAYRHNR